MPLFCTHTVYVHINTLCIYYVTGVSYKWYASVRGGSTKFALSDRWIVYTKVEDNCYTENTFYMKQADQSLYIHTSRYKICVGDGDKRPHISISKRIVVIYN